ncbi:MAG: 5-formyltetrahydrofolate cyclo-ligase [Peptococcaceae bacterium]|nr:5-formyltetrahydrofolate cyclo-ligase [Peptococcaceae bacterium]
MGKQELRREMLKKRRGLTSREVTDKSAVIAHRVLSLPCFARARIIMAYNAVRNEVQTGGLIVAAMSVGKKVALPITDRERKQLIPVMITSYPGPMVEGAYGIPEPAEGNYAPVHVKDIDCLLLPGVAFDPDGYRLGYGGGYYDRFLRDVRRDAALIGLAYEFQICPGVYADSHDMPVDIIVTEKRVIDCR